MKNGTIQIRLSDGQKLFFQRNAVYSVDVVIRSKNENYNNNQIDIENVTLENRYRVQNQPL